MEFNVYDRTLTKQIVIPEFVSLVWVEETIGPGEMQIVVNKNFITLGICVGMFIGIRKSSSLMYIHSFEDKSGQLWFYGFDAKFLLDSRIYDGIINCGNIEKTLRTAFLNTRPYPIMALGALNELPAETESQYMYTSLYALSVAWCELAGYGFRLRHDRENKLLRYEIYEGTVRSNVKFSEKYGNCYGLTRAASESGYKNVAYVAGAGEGMDRTFVVCGDLTAEGLDRREVFVEADDIKMEDDMTQEQYERLLAARGLEKLSEHVKADEISFNIPSEDFGKTFFLGDSVVCVLTEYGVGLTVPVIKVTYTYENNEEKVKLGFGTPVVRRV